LRGMCLGRVVRWPNLSPFHAGVHDVPGKICGGGLEAFNRVGEVLTVGAREVVWIKWGEVSGKEFDESAVLLFFICVVVCSILGPPGLDGVTN
jgi:hypothetical protein